MWFRMVFSAGSSFAQSGAAARAIANTAQANAWLIAADGACMSFSLSGAVALRRRRRGMMSMLISLAGGLTCWYVGGGWTRGRSNGQRSDWQNPFWARNASVDWARPTSKRCAAESEKEKPKRGRDSSLRFRLGVQTDATPLNRNAQPPDLTGMPGTADRAVLPDDGRLSLLDRLIPVPDG